MMSWSAVRIANMSSPIQYYLEITIQISAIEDLYWESPILKVNVFHKSDRHRHSWFTMSLIELSPLFTRRQLKNQNDNNRWRLCPGGPEARQGKGSTGTSGGDVASFPLATTFFSYSLLLIHLSFSYFCGTKYIHKLVPKVKSLPPHLQISADIFLI